MKFRIFLLIVILVLVFIFRGQINKKSTQVFEETMHGKPSPRLIWVAAENAMNDNLEASLENGESANAFDNGIPLIFIPIRGNNVEAIKILIKHGVNLNKPDSQGKLPIVYAKELRRDEIVQLMISAGAFDNGKSIDWVEPYKNKSNLELSQLFNEAVNHGDMVKINDLLTAGLDPNFQDDSGNPLLIQGFSHGNKDLVTLLLDKGASPNSVRNDGTPLFFLSIQNGVNDKCKTFESFLSHGVDVNIKDKSGRTGLNLVREMRSNWAKTNMEEKLNKAGAYEGFSK